MPKRTEGQRLETTSGGGLAGHLMGKYVSSNLCQVEEFLNEEQRQVHRSVSYPISKFQATKASIQYRGPCSRSGAISGHVDSCRPRKV